MAERVPILVGITGKRDLKDQDEVVRDRLRAAFDTLDRETPNVPKVLLSGMAIGADTIAATLALARSDWLVAAVLPFDAETYFEDFDGASLAVLETLLADHRVKTYALPPLANPYTGQPCTREELRNSANATNPLRVMHYEQLGLWLAHASTLLVAVLPKDEQPDQAGGTARVVEYRLSGRPDTVAARVMEASDAVAPPLPLDIAALGPVWLIDAPDGAAPAEPFAAQLSERDRYASPSPRESRQLLQSSLVMPRAFDGLAWRSGGARVPLAWPVDKPDPIAAIDAVHAQIESVQGRHKRRLVSSSYTLAVLFWLAVSAFGFVELSRYVKGNLSLWALGLYLVMAAAAVGLHWTIDRRHWQRVTEDYRGVIEALRVQSAWWHAGLVSPVDQVDRYFLNTAPLPFLYVRQAVRTIVHWARLSGAPQPPKTDWSEVYDHANQQSWIQGQIQYFRDRGDQRKCQIARAKMISWEAFFAAQFLGLWLFIDIVAAKLHLDKLDELLKDLSNWDLPGILLAAAVAIWIVRHLSARSTPPPRRWAAGFAVVLALLIGPALHSAGIALQTQIPHADQLAIALGVVLLSAGAVAVRFVAEKLVWEAEAHRYEAALALFERAARELDRIGQPTDASRIVVRALGRAALEENEYWLRAHRERPVEQAVG